MLRGSAIKHLVCGAECSFVQDPAGQTRDMNLREQGLGISMDHLVILSMLLKLG